MNITLKQRIGPITDLQRKARISITAQLMSCVTNEDRARIIRKVRRWK